MVAGFKKVGRVRAKRRPVQGEFENGRSRALAISICRSAVALRRSWLGLTGLRWSFGRVTRLPVGEAMRRVNSLALGRSVPSYGD